MENLPLFGRACYQLCFLLHIDLTSLAVQAGVSKSSVSEATRGKAMLNKESVKKLFTQFQILAKKQGIEFDPRLEKSFYNLAGHSVEEDKQEGYERISHFTQSVAGQNEVSIDWQNKGVPDF